MRLRVIAQGQVVRDLKVPKEDREALSDGIASFERDRGQWEVEPISLSVADVSVGGLLKSVKRLKENGEEIIVFEFWENS